jgi:hypothetical protein
MPLQPTARDERRHRSGPHRWWGETWAFDAAEDGGPALFARLTVYPRRPVAWFVAGVVRPGEAYVLCRDDGLDPPRQPLVPEIRGEGLWSHVVCETPFDHWTVAMEAYAVALDDPTEAWRLERGDRIGLAFDLEWEQAGPVQTDGTNPALHGYSLPCTVSGTLQVGSDAHQLTASGRRSHHWGVLDAAGWSSLATGGADGPGRSAPWLIRVDDTVIRAQMVLSEGGWRLAV